MFDHFILLARSEVAMNFNKFLIMTVIIFLCIGSHVYGGEYRVGPEDVLRITVYENPDLETTIRVDDEGMVLFPLIGEVMVISGAVRSTISIQYSEDPVLPALSLQSIIQSSKPPDDIPVSSFVFVTPLFAGTALSPQDAEILQ